MSKNVPKERSPVPSPQELVKEYESRKRNGTERIEREARKFIDGINMKPADLTDLELSSKTVRRTLPGPNDDLGGLRDIGSRIVELLPEYRVSCVDGDIDDDGIPILLSIVMVISW